MFDIPLILALELPPLVFSPTLPPPYQMPRELTCDVREICKPAHSASVRIPNLPRFTAPKPVQTYLFGPKMDHFIYVMGILAASASGGNVDTRSPEQKVRDQTFSAVSR